MIVRTEEKAEENKLEQDNLSEVTLGLFYAAENNDIKGALTHINAGADVNAVNPGSSLPTPLSIAVFCLHFDMVKFLLEQGADPNFIPEGAGSLVESLFMRIIQIELDAQTGRPEKRPARWRSFELPFQIKATITEDVIDTAQKILELFVCFQLNHKIQWSEVFQKKKKDLSERYKHQIIATARNQAYVPAINACSTKPSLLISVVTTLLRTAVSAHAFWYRANHDSMSRLHHFVNSVSECEVILVKEAAEVQRDREELRQQCQDDLSSIPDMPYLPRVIARLVTEYLEIDLSQQIAKNRLQQNKSVRFWKPIDPREQQAVIEEKIQEFVDQAKQVKQRVAEIVNQTSLEIEIAKQAVRKK